MKLNWFIALLFALAVLAGVAPRGNSDEIHGFYCEKCDTLYLMDETGEVVEEISPTEK